MVDWIVEFNLFWLSEFYFFFLSDTRKQQIISDQRDWIEYHPDFGFNDKLGNCKFERLVLSSFFDSFIYWLFFQTLFDFFICIYFFFFWLTFFFESSGCQFEENAIKLLAQNISKRPTEYAHLYVAVNRQNGFDDWLDRWIGFRAFLLGTHERVNGGSSIQLLPIDILELIGKHLFGQEMEMEPDDFEDSTFMFR